MGQNINTCNLTVTLTTYMRVCVLYRDFISLLEAMLVSVYISYVILPKVYWGNMIPELI